MRWKLRGDETGAIHFANHGGSKGSNRLVFLLTA
jgi:hypothetical protein